jgi:hypothetical protein
MRLKSFGILLAAMASSAFFANPGYTQSSGTPANFPPSSFNGPQFVDNSGCVFIRAGFDGNVTWVPRMTRQRKQVCGQSPTFGKAQPSTRTAAAPTRRTQVEQISLPATTAAPKPAARPAAAVAPAAKPQPRRVVRQAAPAPKPAVQASRVQQVVRTPASKPTAPTQAPRIVRRAPQAVAAPQPQAPTSTARHAVVPTYSACVNGQRTRTMGGTTVAMRCGSQPTSHVTIIRRGETPKPGQNVFYNKQNNGSWQGSALDLPGSTRIMPRSVYEMRGTDVAGIPAGYMPAWSDDRLNPMRASMTIDGYMQTQQIWTNTLPRYLVSQARNHVVKAPNIVGHGGAQSVAVSSQGRNNPVMSTRSSTGPRAQAAQYVEIGVFTTEAKAQFATDRLSAAGRPVRYGSYKGMRRVMVGPYASPQDINAALRAVRSTGYVQAYTR